MAKRLTDLLQRTNFEANALNCPQLRAVFANWDGGTADISFYFDGEISEEVQEEVYCACHCIEVNLSIHFAEGNYIRLDFPEPLPNIDYLAYLRDEEKPF